MRANEFIKENPVIKLGSRDNTRALAWIDKVYQMYPGTFQNNHVMSWGEGEEQQFAMFELVPSMSKRDAVEVKWFQAYPLRKGVGSRAMAELQRIAREDGIALTLFPWQHGQVSQTKLTKFYKGHGFKPSAKGSKNMQWSPDDLAEAPLADYQPMGDFNRPGPFRGADKKLVPHPVNQLKTAKFFEKTPYDFRLFFSNIPGTGKYSEYGKMSPEVLQHVFGEQAEQIIQGSQDAITVVFVGNKGDSKVMLTPWMMAHRIGHAIQANIRRGTSNGGTWRAAEDHFFGAINNIVADYYGKRVPNQFGNKVNNSLSKEYTALFNAIGTQRSSRTGQITRPYEFLYELFAQYLGTGNVTLKPLPKQQDYGRKVWGKSTQSLKLQPGAEEDSTYATEVLGRDMELMFDDVLSSLVGDVLVM